MSHNGDFGASEGERGSRGGRGGRGGGTRGGGSARGGGYAGRQQGGLRGGDTVHLGTGRVERAEGGESRKWEDKKAFNANRYEDKKDDKNDGGREGRTGTRGRGGDRGRNNNQTDRRFRGNGTEQSGSASAAVAAPAEENFGTHPDFPGVKFGEDGKPIVGFSASRRGRVVGATARAIAAVEGGAVPLSSITFGNDDKTTAQPESQSVAADSVVNEQAPRGYRNRGGAAGGGGRGGERGATTRTDFGPKRDGGYRGASAKPIDEGAAAATGGDEGHGGDSGTARGARAAATAAPSNSEIKADEGDQQHDGFIPLAQSPPPARVLVDDTAGMSSRGHWAGGRGRGGGTFARAAATEGNEQNGKLGGAKRERGDIKTGRSDGRGGGTAGEGGYTRNKYNKDGANTGRGPRDNQATEAANNASKEQTTGYGNRQYAGRRQDDAGGRGGNNTNRRGGRDQARN